MSSGAIVVVEGVDGSGKTTLANELAKRHGDAVILHQVYRWKRLMFEYHTAVLRQAAHLADQGRLVILDRMWPSELVYGKVYRGGSKFWLEGRFMDRVLLKHAAVYVFCSGSLDVLEARNAKLKKERHELYSTSYRELYHAYEELYAQMASSWRLWDILRYSIEANDPVQFSKDILERSAFWRSRQYQPALAHHCQNMLGHVGYAKVLFVGDRCNQKHRFMEWPFYEYGNCSLFMTRCLEELGHCEHEALWTNATCSDQEQCGTDLAKFLSNTVPALNIVALGREASLGLARADVPHQFLPHPQYGRRFDQPEFRRRLSSVLKSHERPKSERCQYSAFQPHPGI